jgi:transglutaminase-like putative cysteine protease
MQITIRHRLSLGLGASAPRAVQHLLLTPRSGPSQTVHEWSIDMPGMAETARFTDGFGNVAHLVSQAQPGPELVISVTGRVETRAGTGVLGRLAGEPMPALFRRSTALAKPVGAVASKFRAAPKPGRDRIAVLHALMARVHEVMAGEPAQSQSQGAEGQSQSQSQGTGQRAAAADHAHAFIATARALEIPARYVTGYMMGEAGVSWHAWAEAHDEGLGWIGFDPVLNLCPTDRHVRVAIGLDATTAQPVRSVPTVGTAETLELVAETA